MEITRLTPKEQRGLVVVITSNGKGKTTTALWIAVRACGHNLRTSIILFAKEGKFLPFVKGGKEGFSFGGRSSGLFQPVMFQHCGSSAKRSGLPCADESA